MKRSQSDSKENQNSLSANDYGRLKGRHFDFSQEEIDAIAGRLFSVYHWGAEDVRRMKAKEFLTISNNDQRKRFRRMAVEVLIMRNEISQTNK